MVGNPCLLGNSIDSNAQEQVWVWNNDGNEYFFDKGETVRFRVEAENWHDQSPDAPSELETTSEIERKAPYSIIVRLLSYCKSTFILV